MYKLQHRGQRWPFNWKPSLRSAQTESTFVPKSNRNLSPFLSAPEAHRSPSAPTDVISFQDFISRKSYYSGPITQGKLCLCKAIKHGNSSECHPTALQTAEFPQSEVEGLHQEGEKSAQAGPDQQLQTNDSTPVS